MGTWGTEIFEDDTAADIRDDYRDLIADGATDKAALSKLRKHYLEESSALGELLEPLFWIALAATQCELGRLDDETKSKAIEIIDSGSEIERWKELDAVESDLQGRQKVLLALREKLNSPQTPPKTPRKPRKRTSPYAVGDVLQFRLTLGKSVLFRITSIYKDRGGEQPIAEILDWIGVKPPPFTELATLQCRPRIKAKGFESVRFPRILLAEFPKDGFDSGRVGVIARVPMPHVVSEAFTMYPWPSLEEALAENFGLK